jgi:polyisoprenoid-binding protein YceI
MWIVGVLVAVVGVGCDFQATVPDVDDIPAEVAGGFNSSGMARPPDVERINPVITAKFVGNHKGDPKPRHLFLSMAEAQMYMPGGKFEDLETLRIGFYVNTVDVDAAASGLDEEGAKKLRDHLRGPDFFNVKQHPTAEFDAKTIEFKEDNTGTITGTLKLLGQTQEMTIPVTIDPAKKWIETKFSIDRTKFGMNYGLDSIEEMVEVHVILDGTKG